MAARLLILIAAIAPLATCFTPTAELPDLLTTIDGRAVTDAAEWNTRRTELQMLVQEHILGYLPSGPPPTLTSARALNSSISGGISSCYIRLAFAANETDVQFDIELAWPTAAFSMLPVMATQWNHRSWGIQAVQRGYMMLLYPGADARDASGAFRAAYPTASFRKILARAFVASRALDFLLTPCGYPVANLTTPLPAVDAQRVSITGHSRNGKQSIIAAAFDKRIFAVVGSSPGTPVASPVRFSSPDFNGETTNFVSDARDWWLPSLKTYFGREHELPADGHMIVALVAPRHLMLATARSDGEGDATFADEQNIRANQRGACAWSPPRRADSSCAHSSFVAHRTAAALSNSCSLVRCVSRPRSLSPSRVLPLVSLSLSRALSNSLEPPRRALCPAYQVPGGAPPRLRRSPDLRRLVRLRRGRARDRASLQSDAAAARL